MRIYHTDRQLIKKYQIIKIITSIFSCIFGSLFLYFIIHQLKQSFFITMLIGCLFIIRAINSNMKLIRYYAFPYSSTLTINKSSKWNITVREKREKLIRTIKFNKPIAVIPIIMGKQVFAYYFIVDETTKKQIRKLTVMNIPKIYKEEQNG